MKPDWLERPPAPDRAYIYVVGMGQGPSVAEAQAAALKDAIKQIASQISVTVTSRSLSTMSNTEDTVLLDSRQDIRARVKDAEAVGTPWTEVEKRGMWPFRRPKSFAVRVLVRYPKEELGHERARQESAWADYKDALDRLAHDLVQALDKSSGFRSIAVSAFFEATTKRGYAFSEIVQRDLSDALTRAGASVVPLTKAGVIVTGAYREIDGQVVVTARLVRPAGDRLAVAEVSFDRDAAPDQWMQIVTPTESFFESTEPERAQADARFGTISIQTRPQGIASQVFVDGDLRGKAPAAFGGIPVGLRSLTVAAPGFEPFIQQVQVVEGETSAVLAGLKPLTGGLQLRSTPSGASVFDGMRFLGKTPLRLADLPLGTMHLTFRLEDYENAAVEARVEEKKVAVFNVTMIEQPGGLLVISDPPGATIIVDDGVAGVAAAPKFLKIERIAAGLHRLVARKRGVGVWGGEVIVSPNKTETVNAVLQSNLGILSVAVVPPDAKVTVDGQAVESPAPEGLSPSGKVANVESLLQVLPGLEGSSIARRRDLTIEGLQRDAVTGRITLPLEAGEHSIMITAPGYQGERRTLAIKPGKTRKLHLEMIPAREDQSIVNEAGGHLFHEVLPLSARYLDTCRTGEQSAAVKVVACILAFPVEAVISLGYFPVVGDLLTLPYHGVRTVSRHFSDPGGGRQ
jgi:hypothetical protein